VYLPLLIFPCTMKSRSSLLAPAHPGGPGMSTNIGIRVRKRSLVVNESSWSESGVKEG